LLSGIAPEPIVSEVDTDAVPEHAPPKTAAVGAVVYPYPGAVIVTPSATPPDTVKYPKPPMPPENDAVQKPFTRVPPVKLETLKTPWVIGVPELPKLLPLTLVPHEN
jgi:hypothetical protein